MGFSLKRLRKWHFIAIIKYIRHQVCKGYGWFTSVKPNFNGRQYIFWIDLILTHTREDLGCKNL